MNTIRKGDKVLGLGRGGAIWKNKPVGTVTSAGKGSVFVQWDDCCVEDEMNPADLLPVYWSTELSRFVTVPE